MDAVNVGTDGSVPAVERARTVLENAYPDASLNAPSTIGDLIEKDHSTNNDYQQLANVVILVSLAIAGCTLAAGIAAGLADRKRPFSLLRLTGARLARCGASSPSRAPSRCSRSPSSRSAPASAAPR